MSTIQWVIIAVIVISAAIYWKWETDREKNNAESKTSDALNSPNSSTELNSRGNDDSLEARKLMGLEAAKRTNKYANLFETIGGVLQGLNLAGGAVLIIVILLIPVDSTTKVFSVIGILLFMGLVYIQTSLIRGLASYFQMKASDHIVRNSVN